MFDLADLPVDDSLPRHNIAPTQKIMTVIYEDGLSSSVLMNWGIKFSKDSPLIFNSRIETIKEKPFWMKLFVNNRCLVPMSTFYEWAQEDRQKKTPYRISLKSHNYFFVPTLYVEREGELFASLITTIPNEFIKKIHHRMPVILETENAKAYFTNNYASNLSICIPYGKTGNMQLQSVAKSGIG